MEDDVGRRARPTGEDASEIDARFQLFRELTHLE